MGHYPLLVYPNDTPVLQCYFYGVDFCLGVNQAENGLTRCKSPPWWLNPSWNGSSSSMLLGCERSNSWRFRAFPIWNFLKKIEATTLHDSYKCYKSLGLIDQIIGCDRFWSHGNLGSGHQWCEAGAAPVYGPLGAHLQGQRPQAAPPQKVAFTTWTVEITWYIINLG